MKIFIDTANLKEIKEANNAGILDGVTTNPSLVKKQVEKAEKNTSIEEYFRKILRVKEDLEVSLEVIGNTYEEMVQEGKRLYDKFSDEPAKVYIKIPSNPKMEENENKEFSGIKAIRELTDNNIPVNTTLIFTPEQALMAAKAGAEFVSPFAGRTDDYIRSKEFDLERGKDYSKYDYYPAEGAEKDDGTIADDDGVVSGINLIYQCYQIFKEHNIDSEILAASIRNARQVREAALSGADIATMNLDIMKELMNHYKTKEGMKSFTNDIVDEYASIVKE